LLVALIARGFPSATPEQGPRDGKFHGNPASTPRLLAPPPRPAGRKSPRVVLVHTSRWELALQSAWLAAFPVTAPFGLCGYLIFNSDNLIANYGVK